MNIFKNLYNYREFVKTNVKKEIRGRYKKSFLGIMWSFLNPLLQLLVYSVIFEKILKNPQPNYTIFLCVGLIPWTFFTAAITQAASTIISNGSIIKKVYFPREILPISVVTSATYNFLISTIIILIFLFASKMYITKYVIFYPAILVVQYLLTLGLSFILSSITVYLRDIEHIIGVILMALFYGTPIVYSSDSIPSELARIVKLNPMTPVIEAYRDIFYYQRKPDLQSLGILFVGTLTFCIISYQIFNKLQKNFAEEL